jgi:Glycosyl transferase family 2
MGPNPDSTAPAMPPKVTRYVLVIGVFVDAVELYELQSGFVTKEFSASPPLVSILIWCGTKYPASYLLGLLLSLERQSYKNWEAVIQTDGPRSDVRQMLKCEWLSADKIHLHETPEVRGWWGFHYKQTGFAQCKGQYIVATNDDNYHHPDYLRKMLQVAELGYDLVICHLIGPTGIYAHCVPIERDCDLACALVRRDLLERVPWPEVNTPSDDGVWIERLGKAAKKVAIVQKALFVHC